LKILGANNPTNMLTKSVTKH